MLEFLRSWSMHSAWDLVTLVLSVFSALASVWALKLAKGQTAESREQRLAFEHLIDNQGAKSRALFKRQEKLTMRLQGLVSTRVIGEFPSYLTDISKMLAGAKHSIRVMTLISSHGSYTAWPEWVQFAETLKTHSAPREQTGEHLQLEIITNTETAFLKAFDAVHPAFRNPENFQQFKQNDAKRLSDFLNRNGFKDKSNLTAQGYYEARYSEHKAVLDSLYRDSGFEIFPSWYPLPLYCWIVDGERAIFSPPTQSVEGRYAGVAISTEDKLVVGALMRLFDHYKFMTQWPPADREV